MRMSNAEPAEVQFSVFVHGFGSQPRVETVAIMGAKVILTLDVVDAIRETDTVMIRYRPPTHRFDGDGGEIVFIPEFCRMRCRIRAENWSM